MLVGSGVNCVLLKMLNSLFILLIHIHRELFIGKKFSVDMYLERTFYWLSLLGDRVIPAIGKHGYIDILWSENVKEYSNYDSWKKILEKHDDGEVIYLQPNQFFLQGRSLQSWLPDLETNFHYPMFLPTLEENSGYALIDDCKYNLALHMGSIKGGRAWNTWTSEDWVKLIVQLHKEFPEIRFVLMGGVWDLDMAMEVIGQLPKDIKVLDLVGRTNITQAIAILKKVIYYIGFSSGLNVLMNVMNLPCTALWPKHQREHIYCHADPETIASRNYLGFVYDDPYRIVIRIRPIIKRELEKVWVD